VPGSCLAPHRHHDGGNTTSVEVFVVPPYDAAIVTSVDAVTAVVAIGKVAVDVFAATATATGTPAAPELLANATNAPPVGASVLRTTVPTTVVPPAIDEGLTIKKPMAVGAGITITVAFFVVPFAVALIVTAAAEMTADVVIVNVADVDPAGTTTDAGTDAAARLLLVNATDVPLSGDDAESVTVA
jgi:hypothetical protein